MRTKFKNTKFKLLALSASLLACGLGVSGAAQANAYAVSANNIINGSVTGLIDGVAITNNSGAIRFGTPTSISSSSATLNGSGQSFSDVSPPAPNANASNGTGSVPLRTNEMTFVSGGGNTYYIANGQDGGPAGCGSPTCFGTLPTNYSNGDAIVVTEQTITGTPIEARNIAESNIATTGFGDADGRNASSTSLTLVDLIVGNDCADVVCTINFSFYADPFIRVFLDAQAGAGAVARGVLAFNANLTNVLTGATVYSWAPNGEVGNGIVGGTELFDAENLNLTVTQLSAGESIHSGPSYANDDFRQYQAFTDRLAVGRYTLSLSMIEKTDVKRISVPEPATLALLGLGLTGLAFARRRKQA